MNIKDLSADDVVTLYVSRSNVPTGQLLSWLSTATQETADTYLAFLEKQTLKGNSNLSFYTALLNCPCLSLEALKLLAAYSVATASYISSRQDTRSGPEILAAINQLPNPNERLARQRIDAHLSPLFTVLAQQPTLCDEDICLVYKKQHRSKVLQLLLDHPAAGPQTALALIRTRPGHHLLVRSHKLLTMVMSDASLRGQYFTMTAQLNHSVNEIFTTLSLIAMETIPRLASYTEPVGLSERIKGYLDMVQAIEVPNTIGMPYRSVYHPLFTWLFPLIKAAASLPEQLDSVAIGRLLALPVFKELHSDIFALLSPNLIRRPPPQI